MSWKHRLIRMYSWILSTLAWLHLTYSRWLRIFIIFKEWQRKQLHSLLTWTHSSLNNLPLRLYTFARPRSIYHLVWRPVFGSVFLFSFQIPEMPAAHILISHRYDDHIVRLVWQCILPAMPQRLHCRLSWGCALVLST